MVVHYALLYGFHTLPNMLIKPLREAHGFVYVCKCLIYDLSGDPPEGREFTMHSITVGQRRYRHIHVSAMWYHTGLHFQKAYTHLSYSCKPIESSVT